MTRWQEFRAVCDYLRAGVLGGAPPGFHPRVSWSGLINAGKLHHVATTLSWCLREEAAIPPDLRLYLNAILRLNGKRNDRVLGVVTNAVRELNAIGIEPVLLKGAAHLASGLYPSQSARVMSDLDILIPHEARHECVAAMEGIGFFPNQTLPDDYHHLPSMRHDALNIVIELHTRLLHRATDPIVPADWFREHSRPIEFQGLRVQAPRPTALIAHNVAHDQLDHHRYQWKQVELRQLLDLAMIRARDEAEIDWKEIDGRYRRLGLGHVLATYLRYNEALFGQPMPAIASAPRTRAMVRLRRAVEDPPEARAARRAARREARQAEQVRQEQARQAAAAAREQRQRARRARNDIVLAPVRRWRRRGVEVAKLPIHFIRARWRDPRGLVRLFSPRAWARRLGIIRRDLKDLN